MARALAIVLIALFAGLPAIDSIWCPDGCTDADGWQLSVRADDSSRNGACGLCLNGLAVNVDVPAPSPGWRLLPMRSSSDPTPVLVLPRSIDRPPRGA